nr:hypothetical protein [uncultured Carboxylicivirga sp.]
MKKISVNQLADFSKATPRGKERIIHQQKYPSKLKVFWYQKAKARIKKSLSEGGDLTPVYKGIQEILRKKPDNKRQLSDKNVSIEALERYIQMGIPKILKDINYQIIKPKENWFIIDDVKLIVAPDVVFTGLMDGIPVIGAIKIHISKTKPFEINQASIVATSIRNFLEQKDEFKAFKVHPGLCMSIDIFGERVIAAKEHENKTISDIKKLCQEIKELWDVA